MIITSAKECRFYSENDIIVRSLSAGHPFEPETAAWLSAIKPSGLFVDVGASTGFYAIPAAMEGWEVIAFEPLPASYRRLLKNAKLNDLELDARNFAVSSEIGTATLFYNRRIPLTSGASLREGDCLSPTAKITVAMVPLDATLSESVGVLKIDVEGHEVEVLSGAEKTIEKSRPFLALEANTPDNEEKIRDWLKPFDYDVRIADVRNLLCTPF